MESARAELDEYGLAPYQANPICQKCGDFGFHWEWFREIRSEGYFPERLTLTCMRCGWSFRMKTKDDALLKEEQEARKAKDFGQQVYDKG